ncbi:hypothetical protein [Pseudomonas tohonis]|uniref:hypothetical protein n=1 Tax=Pseudomonas tohonis TaxID=2725477 RepID=UPI0021D9684D|nr:hypothetical protein [Pseudomonas tohonis]UXY55409.1 hypothetical protein N9L84_12820 [Pseudomonas tohonis]
MKAPLLLVDKVEFPKIFVEANENYDGEFWTELHKLKFNFKGSRFLRNVGISYPEDEIEDPRSFIFDLTIRLMQEDQDEVTLPYEIEVDARALMYYRADKHKGEELFKAVRATGYAILYGSIREMVSNLTARGPNGMWVLPGADFLQAATEEALEDERARQKKIALASSKKLNKPTKKPRRISSKNESPS